jgi:hypothetical protein
MDYRKLVESLRNDSCEKCMYCDNCTYSCLLDINAADAIENLLNDINAQQEIMSKQADLNAELTKRVLELEKVDAAIKNSLIGKSIAEIKEFEGIPVERLKEFAEAEREGRLVVLPAKTVFVLTWDAGPGCDLVCPLKIDGEGQCDCCEHGEIFAYEVPCKQEHIKEIGKTVFLTREEAAAALAAEKGGAE